MNSKFDARKLIKDSEEEIGIGRYNEFSFNMIDKFCFKLLAKYYWFGGGDPRTPLDTRLDLVHANPLPALYLGVFLISCFISRSGSTRDRSWDSVVTVR